MRLQCEAPCRRITDAGCEREQTAKDGSLCEPDRRCRAWVEHTIGQRAWSRGKRIHHATESLPVSCVGYCVACSLPSCSVRSRAKELGRKSWWRLSRREQA